MNQTAKKLRVLADKMEPAIEAKMNPGIANQNLTPRRIAIARSMRHDGERLRLVQAALYRLAEAHANDDWSALLNVWGEAPRLKTKAAVEKLYFEGRQYLRCTNDGESIYSPSVLHQLVGASIEETPAAKLRRMEEDLVGRKIPGFFPTPRDLADRMVSIAGIGPGQRVLEPSAGKGDLAERIKAQAPYSEVHVIEVNHTLVQILRAKGFDVTHDDLFNCHGQWDRIVMNPPFEDGQDMAHIQYCFDELLRPGGRLVSIISEGPFFRDDKKSQAFREWLSDYRTGEFKVADAFEGVQAFRQTGVAVRVITLDKPY